MDNVIKKEQSGYISASSGISSDGDNKLLINDSVMVHEVMSLTKRRENEQS